MTITIEDTDWGTHGAALTALRQVVFVEEQGVPAEDEWDDADATATHFLVLHGQEPIGCARLCVDAPVGKVGRVCIVPGHRRRGFADALMRHVIEHARVRRLTQLTLDAQTYVVSLYEKLGFVVEGELFLDAGIPHRRMHLALAR